MHEQHSIETPTNFKIQKDKASNNNLAEVIQLIPLQAILNYSLSSRVYTLLFVGHRMHVACVL